MVWVQTKSYSNRQRKKDIVQNRNRNSLRRANNQERFKNAFQNLAAFPRLLILPSSQCHHTSGETGTQIERGTAPPSFQSMPPCGEDAALSQPYGRRRIGVGSFMFRVSVLGISKLFPLQTESEVIEKISNHRQHGSITATEKRYKFTMPSYVRPPSQSKRSYLPFSTPSSHGSPPHTRPGLPSPIAPPQSPPSPSPIRSLQGSHQAPTDSSTGTDHHRARHRRHTTPGHLQYHLQYHRLPAHSPSGLTPSQSLPHPRTLKMAPYTLLIRTRSSKKDTPCRSWGTSTEPLFCPGHARRY